MITHQQAYTNLVKQFGKREAYKLFKGLVTPIEEARDEWEKEDAVDSAMNILLRGGMDHNDALALLLYK